MPTIAATVAQPSSAPSPLEGGAEAGWKGALIASLGLLAVCWLLIFNQQRLEWSVNPTYAYGWAVPFLAGFLFWERWSRRAEARAPWGGRWWLVIPAVLLLAYLPARVVQEANPDWVKVNWTLAGIAMAVSFFALFALGGLRYVVFFAFPVLFCFTALPWPVWMEDYLVQTLMRGNASICAEILTIAGYPAFAKGNLIQVGTTWVNVEEACSGIRSLQTAFMVSLFFGEYYRFGLLSRAALLVSSFVVAFVLNIGRTLVLTYISGQSGSAVMEKWHDTVGTVVMVLCLVALWGLAELFQRFRGEPAASAKAPVVTKLRRAPFPLWFAAAGMVWLGLSEVATAAWYGYHERRMPPAAQWEITLPTEAPGFRQIEFAERTRAILKYNEGKSASWRSTDGYRWQMYYLRWFPGRVSKFLSSSHYPTVCLPAGGLRLVAETGRFECRVGGLTIPFTTYLFDEGGRDVYVFHAIMEDVPTTADGRPTYRQAKTEERIASVLRGERNLGQRVMGIAITGPILADDARAAVASLISEIVQTPNPRVARAH